MISEYLKRESEQKADRKAGYIICSIVLALAVADFYFMLKAYPI